MPSQSVKQKNYILYLRGKYKTKSDTPEKDKFIWDDGWLKVKESSFRSEIKAWITPEGDYLPFHRLKNHDDMLPLGVRYTDAIRKGWIRVYKTPDTLHITCDTFDAKKLKHCTSIFSDVDELRDIPIVVADGRRIINYKPLFKENYMERYTPYFDESIEIPLEKGDTFSYGKFKNRKAVFDHSFVNDKGDVVAVTDSGKEIVVSKIRVMKEDLHLSDFAKHSGISDFTKRWMLDRRRLKGAGNINEKIKSIKVNRKKDYITIVFKTIPTYKKKTQIVDPKTMNFKNGTMYTQEIRIQDFFKYAETKPGFIEKEMTWKEIKEVIGVCPISVFCSCGSFQYQGMNAVVTSFDAAIYPEYRWPKRWDKIHKDYNFVCKHLDLLFSSMDFFKSNITSMINRYLKS